ncbi:hypothetical protein [Deinococcus hopiensis]|uniref:Uncharacterized protein n=1 Tax=Deinococcus hopiensis KR-140 TaxID=695939 RepID=A0A1W1VJ12_9DEIO|nr:hypothetical protein [Deinococcus hopiensis]SMB93369.1 hypothetical protein SAMN00790413_01955 [Deinococcus hopiensis KR-140]
MMPLLYPISSATFPHTGVIDIPCYTARSFNRMTAELECKGTVIPFDFSELTSMEIEAATGEQTHGWTLQALAAVDSMWLIGALEAATSGAVSQSLGAQIEDVWYSMKPLRSEEKFVAGHAEVVGLYR